MTAVLLTDPTTALVGANSNALGQVVDNVRSECGFLLNAIDWICRKLGLGSPVEWVTVKLGGDFNGVDNVRLNLGSLGVALRALSENYTDMANAVHISWKGNDADGSKATMSKLATTHSVQGEGTGLMGEQVGNYLMAVEEGMKLIASIVGLLADELLSIPVAKVLELLVTGISKIKRWARLIKTVIETVKKIIKLVETIFHCAKMFNRVMLGVKLVVQGIAVHAHESAGSTVDDTASAAYT